jgi:hypothetical protein
VQSVFVGELLDPLDARARNRLCQIVDLVLHRITGKVKFREYEKVDALLSRRV